MEGINEQIYKVLSVPTPYTFTIGSLADKNYGKYIRNGIVEEVKGIIETSHLCLNEVFNCEEPNLNDNDMDFEFIDKVPFFFFLYKCFWKFSDEK